MHKEMLEIRNKNGGVKMFIPGTVYISMPVDTSQLAKLPLLHVSFAGLPHPRFSSLLSVSIFYDEIQSSYVE